MIYILLICGMTLGALLALASFIAALVQTIKTRWASAAAWAVLMVFLIVGVAGTGVWVVARGVADATRFTQRKAKELEAQNARQAAEQAQIEKTTAEARGAQILALTPEALRSGIDPEFWSQSGMFDWYRRPLRFPYVVVSTDTLDHGSLTVNVHHGKCDSGAEGVRLAGDITRYTFDGKMILCEQERDGKKSWVCYGFDGNQQHAGLYATEESMLDAARAAGFAGPLPLQTVKEQYDLYWK